LAALVWLQTALVRSDISQIVLAFTPVIVILGLLAKMECTSPARSFAASAAFFAWPSLNLSAPANLGKVIRGETTARATIRGIYTTRRLLEAGLPASMVTSGVTGPRDASSALSLFTLLQK
jgi:hypothetical protein